MNAGREEIIEAIRQRLRSHRELLLRRLGGRWPDEMELSDSAEDDDRDLPIVQELHQTELALEQIRRGEFGFCRQCHHQIAGERLEIVPFATVCIRCQMAEHPVPDPHRN